MTGTRTIVFSGGRNPWEDIHGFKAYVKAKHPGISDKGINQVVKLAVGEYQPRIVHQDGSTARIVMLFGADIMTADLETLPAWPYLAPSAKQRLADHPIVGGATVDPENVQLSRAELANRLERHTVNRSALVSIAGMEQSYVWSADTPVPWTQMVSENDYHLIMGSPQRRLFRDPDLHGPYVPVRSYDAYQVAERHTGNKSDLVHYIKETTRQPQWSGADVAS